MNYRGSKCVVERFNTLGAQIKTSFDTSEIVSELHITLEKQLAKQGLILGQGSMENEVVVKGRFVRIDEGDRLLRYFLTFLAGKAAVEVEGELFYRGRKVAALHAVEKRSAGLFGGSSKGLVRLCANSCGQRIVKQVVSNLNNLWEHRGEVCRLRTRILLQGAILTRTVGQTPCV